MLDPTRRQGTVPVPMAPPPQADVRPVLRPMVPEHLVRSLGWGLDPDALTPVRGDLDAATGRYYALADVVMALAARMGASDDAVVSRREAAAWLNRNLKTLEAWAAAGFGPRIVRMGRRGVGYRVGELRRWVRQQERDPFSSAADPATA
jgi:hypothetical protein